MVSVRPCYVTYGTFKDANDARILIMIAVFLENCGLSISGCNNTGFLSLGGGGVERICSKIGCTHYNNRNEVYSYAFQASLKKLSTELHCTLGKE